MVAASILSHGMDNIYYLGIFIPVMALGVYFQFKNKRDEAMISISE